MNLIERVKESKVFAQLSREDRGDIVTAIKAGDAVVIRETKKVLKDEDSINNLCDRTIEVLTESIAARMNKWFERKDKLQSIAKKEEKQKRNDLAVAEAGLKDENDQ